MTTFEAWAIVSFLGLMLVLDIAWFSWGIITRHQVNSQGVYAIATIIQRDNRKASYIWVYDVLYDGKYYKGEVSVKKRDFLKGEPGEWYWGKILFDKLHYYDIPLAPSIVAFTGIKVDEEFQDIEKERHRIDSMYVSPAPLPHGSVGSRIKEFLNRKVL